MAINILPGPNCRIAVAGGAFAEIGFTAENTVVIYEVEGNYKSWKPGRSINAITACTPGYGYIIVAKTEMDLTAYFSGTFILSQIEDFIIGE